jgi:hypothetical protein
LSQRSASRRATALGLVLAITVARSWSLGLGGKHAMLSSGWILERRIRKRASFVLQFALPGMVSSFMSLLSPSCREM